MNLDDETLLSAYLDDALDPGERLRVESALRSDPRLAARLRELARVRDWVAGLPRPPSPVDLAPAVRRQIAFRPPRSDTSPAPRVLPRPLVRALGLAAAAAFLVAAAVGLILSHLPARPGARPMPAPVVAAGPRLTPSAPAVRVASPPREAPAPRAPVAPPPASARNVAFNRQEAARAREQREFLKMLDSPQLTKVFLVTDVVGGRASEKVGDLVENTPRVNARYGRVTISQGIVIDPDHPNEATVFALVMTGEETDQLRAALHRSFPEHVEETAPDPAVVTQLADIGQVTIAPGKPVSALVAAEVPVNFEALRATPAPPRGDASEPPDQERGAPALARRRPSEEAPPALAHREAEAALARSDRRGSSVVLVWVTTR